MEHPYTSSENNPNLWIDPYGMQGTLVLLPGLALDGPLPFADVIIIGLIVADAICQPEDIPEIPPLKELCLAEYHGLFDICDKIPTPGNRALCRKMAQIRFMQCLSGDGNGTPVVGPRPKPN
jgi:hypothetical protein